MERRINKQDIMLGIIMLALAIYNLVGDNVIVGQSILKESVVVGRADFYIKFLSIILILISITLIFKALGLFGFKTEKSPNESISNIVKLSFAALIVYMFILKPIGFYISSFLLITFLSFIIRIKEDSIDIKNRKSVLKALIISCVFSVITVSLVMYVFTNWLKVVLP